MPTSVVPVRVWSIALRSWPASCTRMWWMRLGRRSPGGRTTSLAAEHKAEEAGRQQDQQDPAAEQKEQCGDREADRPAQGKSQLLLDGGVVRRLRHRRGSSSAGSSAMAAYVSCGAPK